MEHGDKFVITGYEKIMIGCLIRDGKVFDIRCYQEDSLIGNIYVARVSNILTNIGAAFCDIQKGVSCYLPLEDYTGSKALRVGDELLVQVVKDGIKTKQPSVTTRISVNGEYSVVGCFDTVGVSAKIKGEAERDALKKTAVSALEDFKEESGCEESLGAVLRTRCQEQPHSVLYEDIKKTANHLIKLLARGRYLSCYSVLEAAEPAYMQDIGGLPTDISVVTDETSVYEALCARYGEEARFSLYKDDNLSLKSLYNIPLTIEKALQKRAYLKCGGYLVIEPTEAMTVIDVNSGKAVKGKNREEDLLKINLEAAHEIARQLRLRNLSGIILIDFISMKNSANESLVMEELRRAMAPDHVGAQVVDMTKLGLCEVTRKKRRKPLHEVL